MTIPTPSSRTIDFLIQRGRLESIDASAAARSATQMIERAQRRLLTAGAGLQVGDQEGGFAASYDAYRIAAEALLVCQGLRATGGDGSHMTVEDAISAQFAETIAEFAKPTFERLRRTRHSAQYFDPSAPEISVEDAQWALVTATAAVSGAAAVLQHSPPPRYS